MEPGFWLFLMLIVLVMVGCRGGTRKGGGGYHYNPPPKNFPGRRTITPAPPMGPKKEG